MLTRLCRGRRDKPVESVKTAPASPPRRAHAGVALILALSGLHLAAHQASAQGAAGTSPAPCEEEANSPRPGQQYRGVLPADPRLQNLLRETEESGVIYLTIDVAASRLYVKRGSETLRECVISAGSGRVLRRGNKAWRFETPRGMFTVLARERNPVWVMPDWAFAEVGRSAPPAGSPKRRVRGVLGRYALDLGGGYKIHGTPFVGQLGRNVTHGCIRVGADDLQFIWDTAAVGTRVFIR